MNYDLFIPAVVVENAPVTVGSTGRRQDGPVDRLALGAANRSLAETGTTDRPPRDSASEPLFTEEVGQTVAALNEVFKQAHVDVRYRIDKDTGDLVISLVDHATNEVIRQVPPDQILKLRQRIEEFLGVVFDQTA